MPIRSPKELFVLMLSDVRQGAEFMDGLERPAALDPILPAYEEKDGGTDKDDGTKAGIQGLNGVSKVSELELMDIEDKDDDQGDDGQTEHTRGGTQGQMRLLNPFGSSRRLFGNKEQFCDDFAETRAGKAIFNAAVKHSNRLDDFFQIEPAKVRNALFHSEGRVRRKAVSARRKALRFP